MDLIGWVIFIVALLFSVMLHETGHFVTAKKFGMKVTRYFVGFGPTIWSTWRGETEYGIKALPFGGFVKIVGMTSLDEVDDPEDEPRSFRRHPAWQRIIVLCAGSFMHFVLAFVLIFGLAARHRHRQPATPPSWARSSLAWRRTSRRWTTASAPRRTRRLRPSWPGCGPATR